jgi:uncharacterized protein Yka (UPF0111/DUF47 family)
MYRGALYRSLTTALTGQNVTEQNVQQLSLSHSTVQIYHKLVESLNDLLHAADVAQTSLKKIIQEHHFEEALAPWKKDGERMPLIDVILPEIVQQAFYSMYLYMKQKSHDPEYVEDEREQKARMLGMSSDENLAQSVSSSVGRLEKRFDKLYRSLLGRLYPGDFSSSIYHRTYDKLPGQARLMDALHQLKVWALVLSRRAKMERSTSES